MFNVTGIPRNQVKRENYGRALLRNSRRMDNTSEKNGIEEAAALALWHAAVAEKNYVKKLNLLSESYAHAGMQSVLKDQIVNDLQMLLSEHAGDGKVKFAALAKAIEHAENIVRDYKGPRIRKG
jgi:hypothetical protein